MLKSLLRSDLIWRLSGLTYPTSVLATHGRLESVSDYHARCENQVQQLAGEFRGSGAVLEFGCGLGGNLLACCNRFAACYGLDINPRFVAIARSLASRAKVSNARFLVCDGLRIPSEIPSLDSIFSIGVFERIAQARTESILRSLVPLLKPDGVMLIYFLARRARGTSFTRLLGDDAYVYWEPERVLDLFKRVGMQVSHSLLTTTGDVHRPEPSFGDVYVCTKAAI